MLRRTSFLPNGCCTNLYGRAEGRGHRYLTSYKGAEESVDDDKLFADLDALNEQHIEVGLAAGVWKGQVRALVQHFLYDLMLKRFEAAADRLTEMEKAMRLAVGEAIKAKTRASAALIIAEGAMVAAMAGAVIAVLALRKYGCQPPW